MPSWTPTEEDPEEIIESKNEQEKRWSWEDQRTRIINGRVAVVARLRGYTNATRGKTWPGRHCCFVTPDGQKRCIIGSLVTVSEAFALPAGHVKRWEVWSALPAGVRELGVEFLQEMQWMHDNDLWWGSDTDSGLNSRGEERLRMLEVTFCL